MGRSKSLARLAVALLCVSAPAQTHRTVRHMPRTEDGVSPAVAEAEAALDHKDYTRAEALLEQATAANAQDYRAWFDLGVVHENTGRKAEAVEDYTKSVALKNDFFESNFDLGMLLGSLGRLPEAASYLRNATQLTSSNPATAQHAKFAAWYALASALEPSSPAQAVAAYRQAATLEPRDFDTQLKLAQLLEQGHDPAAERAYQAALAIQPNSQAALRGLVNFYITSKQTAKAKQELGRYLEVNPQSAQARLLLAHIDSAAGAYADAVQQLEAAQKLAPGDETIARELAENAALAQKYDLAQAQYQRLLQAHPRDASLHFALGTLLMDRKQFPQSESELIAAVKLNPKSSPACGNLATVAAENHHYQLALAALDLRAQSLPESAGTYFLRATSLDHLRRYKEASENYKLFLAADHGQFPDQEWQARHRLLAIEPK